MLSVFRWVDDFIRSAASLPISAHIAALIVVAALVTVVVAALVSVSAYITIAPVSASVGISRLLLLLSQKRGMLLLVIAMVHRRMLDWHISPDVRSHG
jgi:hypothetical protein